MLLWLLTAATFPPTDVEVTAAGRDDLVGPLTEAVDAELDDLVDLYEHLHANPELSRQEQKTSARLAKELKKAGFEVTREVGGTGVVAVRENGAGPTVLVRADMDGLPVQEATELTYASGSGVMHACGHDVHMTSLVGTARALDALSDRWRGTAVLIAQPAEEVGAGAREMIADGLFERFPKPDAAVALHVGHAVPAGTVELVPGWASANVDMVDVTFFGRGGHGARPHQAVDPIAIGATFVTSLQTVVSRRVDPIDEAVITVGSFHAGTKHNVIPDEAHLQLTVRSYTDAVRQQLLDGITEIATGTCAAMQCTAPPEITVRDEYTPAAYNHPGLTEVARTTLGRLLGEDQVTSGVPGMGGEDFGRYSRELGIPALQFRLGTAPADAFDAEGRPTRELPSLHSARYAPDAEPSVRTGALTLAAVTLELLASP